MADSRPTWATRRASVETRLSDVVARNRFTIAIVFPTMGAALMLASRWGYLPAALSFNPALLLFGTAIMRLPLAAAVLPLLDRRALVALGLLTVYTYAIELVGVATGWPYGEFSYGVSLGPMVGETVPAALALFFLPLVLDAYFLTLLLLGDRLQRRLFRVPVAIGLVLAIDLVLDPAAVGLGFWRYATGGFYGVPFSNFAGWVVSATVAIACLDLGFDLGELRRRIDSCSFALDDLVSFVLLWGLVNGALLNWLPLLVAASFGLALHAVGRLDLLSAVSLPGDTIFRSQ